MISTISHIASLINPFNSVIQEHTMAAEENFSVTISNKTFCQLMNLNCNKVIPSGYMGSRANQGLSWRTPASKAHGANMGPYVGPTNFAIWDSYQGLISLMIFSSKFRCDTHFVLISNCTNVIPTNFCTWYNRWAVVASQLLWHVQKFFSDCMTRSRITTK